MLNSKIMKQGGAFLALLLSSVLPVHAATPLGPATWGNPDQPWGTRRPVTHADKAAVAAYRGGSLQPSFFTRFNNQAELGAQWLLQSDDARHLKSCRQPDNDVATSEGLRFKTLVASHCQAQWSTGSIWSKARYGYGFFEATIKAAGVSGINNAFWLTTNDHFEIDIAEIHYPDIVRLTLHNNNNWSSNPSHAVGFNSKFADDFSASFHDYGVLWTPTDIVFEIDGEPVAAITTGGSIKGTADIRFSTAVMEYAGKIPSHPEGNDMIVKSLRVFALQGDRQ